MLNLVDKLVFVIPTETTTKEVKDAIESMPDTSVLPDAEVPFGRSSPIVWQRIEPSS